MKRIGISFTFHNVSIKSLQVAGNVKFAVDFTFHNVSIKSGVSRGGNTDKSVLYIPQCIY